MPTRNTRSRDTAARTVAAPRHARTLRDRARVKDGKRAASGGGNGEAARTPGVTLTEKAYMALEEMIVHGVLAAGSVVTEAMLADRLRIGRTPIREALQRLAREHLVTIQPRRSVTIAPIDVRSQLRMLELRRAVESLVVVSAARRASPEERATFADLADAFQRSARARDDVTFMRVDREFNELCIRAARNEFAAVSMRLIAPLARRYWIHYSPKAGDVLLVARLHAALSRAISLGKQQQALRALSALLDEVERFTRATATAEF